MKKVVCIGSLNVDILLSVDEFCEDDGEQVIKKIDIFPGGQAGNIAAGLGKLGKNTYFFGNIGSDNYTRVLLDDFDNLNINYSFAKKTYNPNNFVYCLVNGSGERRLYTYNYADFTAEDFSEELYKDTEFIVFTSLIKEDVIEIYTEIAKKAKSRGIKIALDPGNIFARLEFEKLKPLLEFCDYFFPSLNEVKLLVGSMENISNITELVPNFIVTCGDQGVMFFKDNNENKIPNPKKVDKIDSTGAGDCFVAGFIAGLLDGKTEKQAINFAMHAALLSITKKGARSMPSAEEINKFLSEDIYKEI
ncbi:hypothetical protein GF386_04505 [Candidatus Pacearchaeota archaeon]|nr:hypothetical protein [Candidatus Pacearchaeota archaeon]MBD3283386.1 hypothetical protein [Candidatus Pacearchaeota archaeon]